MDPHPIRLWRARRRHVHIDAELSRVGRLWTLTFLRNDRPLARIEFASEQAARGTARAKLRELQIAGWTEHW